MRLESIRNRSGLMLAVIGVAMLAFIMMDLMSSQSSGGGQIDVSVGKVYDESIDAQDFENRVQEQYEQQKQNNPNINLNDVRNSVWNILTRELVFQKEYNFLGISVCNEELFDMIQGSDPYPTIKQAFTNPETGEFDRNSLLTYLKEDINNDQTGQSKAQWLRFEDALYKERLNKKYLTAVSKGLNVSDLHAEINYKEKGEVRNVSYIDISFRTISDSLIDVNDSELVDFMKLNETDYQQKSSRSIEYVIFPVIPSDSDKKSAFSWLENIKDDFSNTKNDIDFINRYSDVSYNPNITYVEKNKLGSQTKDLFSSKIGTIVGPYEEGNNNYRLAKLVDRQNRPDSVKARHILLTGVNAESISDSLKNVLKSGTSFSKLAKEFSQDPGSANQGGDLGWFIEGKMVAEFNNVCFDSKVGEISIVNTQFGTHLIQVTNISSRSKKVKLVFLDRNIVASNDTYQKIFTQAGKFAAETSNQTQFNDNVINQNLTKRIADNILESTENISGLESPREMVRWAYDSKIGQVSDVMEFGNKFVIATLNEIKEEGLVNLDDVRDQVAALVRNNKRGKIISDQLQNLDLNTISTDFNSKIKKAEGIMFNNINIPGLGDEPNFVGACYALDEGEVSGPIIGTSSVYVIRVDQIIESPDGDYSSILNQIKTNLQNRVNLDVYNALEELAEIEDNRFKFY